MPSSQLVVERKRRRNTLRFIRATWRDSLALWREFRRPVTAFLLVAIVGGFIYGELYYAARGVFIDLIDRPYHIIQLMLFAAPEEAPSEWYLVLFWYLMPVMFVLIVGRGAADFVQLFFNRDESRDSWREAVASTYRNHIIVLGAGHVGLRIVRALVQMNIDVVVIDDKPDMGLDELCRKMDVPLIVADARLPNTLEKAGLLHAEAVVICTGNDHINLDVTMRVRDMNPDVRIVARVWEDQFARQIEHFMNVQSVLSSSNLSAPVFAGAALGVEITQTLQIQGVDYSTLHLRVEPGSFMDGVELGTLQTEHDMDIVLHERGEKIEVEPGTHIVVRAGDALVIFARHDRILDVVSRNRIAD